MRRISPGTVMVFVVAILAGLMGAFVIKQMMQQAPVVAEIPQMVIVSRVNLSENQRLNRRVLEQRPLQPNEQMPDHAIESIDVAANRFVRLVVPAQTPITDDMLYEIGKNPIERLTERIADGMRARTIQVHGLVYGSTLIRHNSQVDIAITVETDHPDVKSIGLKGIGTKTLQRNIRVLAVINPPERPRAGASLNGLTSIVVEVTPDQANTLALAEKIGSLSVSVVGNGDAGPGAQDGVVTPNDLIGLSLPTPPAPPLIPPPLPPDEPEEVFQVEHYRGGKMQVQTFGPEQINESRSMSEGQDRRSSRPRFRSSRAVKQPADLTETTASGSSQHQTTPKFPPAVTTTPEVVHSDAIQSAIPPKSSYVSHLEQLPGMHEVPNSYVSDPSLLPGFQDPPSSYANRFLQPTESDVPVPATPDRRDDLESAVRQDLSGSDSAMAESTPSQSTQAPRRKPTTVAAPMVQPSRVGKTKNPRVVASQKEYSTDAKANLTERIYASVRREQKQSLYSRFEN